MYCTLQYRLDFGNAKWVRDPPRPAARHPDGTPAKANRRQGRAAADPSLPRGWDQGWLGGHGAIQGGAARRAAVAALGQCAARRGGSGTGAKRAPLRALCRRLQCICAQSPCRRTTPRRPSRRPRAATFCAMPSCAAEADRSSAGWPTRRSRPSSNASGNSHVARVSALKTEAVTSRCNSDFADCSSLCCGQPSVDSCLEDTNGIFSCTAERGANVKIVIVDLSSN